MSKRLLQVVVVCCAGLTMLGAGTPATRFDRLGHQLMCSCGCAEILLECNHMGCPDSPGMIADLHAQVGGAAGGPGALSDKGVLNWFAAKYGPTVLAAPIRDGFDLVAWIVPFAVLALGIAGVVFVVRLWHNRQAVLHPAVAATVTPSPMHDSVRDRIRRETTFEP